MSKVKITNNTNLDKGSGVMELTSTNKADFEKLKNGGFVTDDPNLVLILNVLHGHKVITTGYLKGYRNMHFVFERTECLDTHREHWNEIARDDCAGYINLFLYMSAFLNEPEKDSFNKLMQDLQTFDKEEHN